ncbi:YciI family protein [Micromonospora sp. CPCC 206061]|uniref:YciI family protein n=1 Tax=Micromonospora sp. CPCC 206061 TaxID=3122410 RepID=UPI002FF00A87
MAPPFVTKANQPPRSKEHTMQYAMLICGDEDAWTDLTPAGEEEVMKEIYAWYEKWQPSGKIADGGVELQPKHTAKTIRRGTDGAPVVTDGPYVELKEVIGSIVMLECDSIDEAVRIASEWPSSGGMNTIEVRPVMVRE